MVDNGINAQSAVLLARRLGIEVIVIDHHSHSSGLT
jgi:single-stranded DNA-specific DHH superfamily exonuclease